MNFWSFVYTLAICSSCIFFLRFYSLQSKILFFAFGAVVINLPMIYGLSLVDWVDSCLGQPSLFLFFLSLSACFLIFYAPREEILPVRSKAFIVVFGFVVFAGNLNLLWGFDLFALNFDVQIAVVLAILLFALSIDLFLGILYLLCLVVFAFGLKENIFLYLIDVSVWLYALIWLIAEGFLQKRKY